MRHWFTALCSACLALAVLPAAAAPPVDAITHERIADAGFNHGEVIDTAAYLADQIGGRLTNSPAMREAERWTQSKFSLWGLRNVHAEGFEFGRGWWIETARARLVVPRALEIRSIPVAWTPSTPGKVSLPVIVAPIRSERDFATWKGKLAGKLVLVSWPEPPKDSTEAPFHRLTDADIGALAPYVIPHVDPDDQERLEQLRFAAARDAFLASEGALAWARMSVRPGRLVHGEGYSFQVNRTPKLPGLEIAAEDYRRLARLAKVVPEVRVEIETLVHYEDADTKAYNVLAEIPGREPKAGYVMAGAHLDSWVAGDGAADNGAGCAVVMEAARILASLGVQPKRTIRFALWAGEEQGLRGSAAYIDQHLARRPRETDPLLAEWGQYYTRDTYPIEVLPGFAELAAYFNVDNGSGRIRGIHTEGNFGAGPILREWLGPFAAMGAGSVVSEPRGGTDHVLMSRLGLPAFQFIQDPLDYDTRVHHSDLDVFDHLRTDDLRQAAVVLATLLLDAADYEHPLPHRALPTKPRSTDPFHYPEPSKP